MRFEIEPLPYPTDALAPTQSAAAVELHYHSFHWRCMHARGGEKPSGAMLGSLEAAFGSSSLSKTVGRRR